LSVPARVRGRLAPDVKISPACCRPLIAQHRDRGAAWAARYGSRDVSTQWVLPVARGPINAAGNMRGLCRGQVGTVVESLAPGVFEVEFSDNAGRAYASLALRAAQLLVPRPRGATRALGVPGSAGSATTPPQGAQSLRLTHFLIKADPLLA
jgi:Domain of unknown function (DUF4926)